MVKHLNPFDTFLSCDGRTDRRNQSRQRTCRTVTHDTVCIKVFAKLQTGDQRHLMTDNVTKA